MNEQKNVSEKIEALQKEFATNPVFATSIQVEAGALCGETVSYTSENYEAHNDKWFKDVSGF